MKKREAVGIFRHRQCRFVHQLADGEVRQQKTIELLPYQFWGFAAQHDLAPPEMGLQFVKRVFYLPPLVIEGGQFFGWRPEWIQDGSHQPVDRLSVGYALKLIVNDTNSYAFRFVPRILLGRIDDAPIRTIAQSFVYLESQVLAHSPEQVATASLGFGPQLETEEKSIRQTQHPGLQLGNHLLGQSDLAGGVASHPATQQHMRAILQKRDEAQLRISTRSPAGGGTPKLVFVLLGVGHIQGAAVQANQSPSSIPRPARLFRSDRYNYLLIQSPQGFRAQTGARLRNAALAGGPHGFLGLGQPLDAFQQAAQHFPIGRLHVQRQRDHVVHHQMRWQFSLPDAGLTSRSQNRIDFLPRNRSADHPKADVIRDSASGGQTGKSASHGAILSSCQTEYSIFS